MSMQNITVFKVPLWKNNYHRFCNSIWIYLLVGLGLWHELGTIKIMEGVYTWNFIPLWNSSRDEIVPVYGEVSLTVYTFFPRWNFIPGWKKRRVNTSFRDEILKWRCFFNFWRMYLSMFSKFNMFEHNQRMNVMKHKASL